MVLRRDVSLVSPQGAYVATRCPYRAQCDVIRPGEPLSPSPVAERRVERGRLFEAEVLSQLASLHPDAVLVPIGGGTEREAATVSALRVGAEIVLGGRLPTDWQGRRVGEPDLLVRARGSSGYRAIDVKAHGTHAPGPGGTDAACSSPEAPALEDAQPAPGWAKKRRADLLQLAHYQRMLEAAGFSAPDGRFGGIIGTEGQVVWYDLDIPMWFTPSSSGKQKKRSTMEVYDFEFDFRLDIIAAATEHQADKSVGLVVVPVRTVECSTCPWWGWCEGQLSAGYGDVSLLPRTGWAGFRLHRAHGVTDRHALALLDHRTATLVSQGVDLRPLLAAVDQLPGTTSVEQVMGRRKTAQLARLHEAGIATADNARALSRTTASYCDEAPSALPEQVDMARAALGPAPAYRRRGVGTVQVPRGDLEVDIDMENVEEGVYLWGALVTDRTGRSGIPDGYRSFARWAALSPELEAELFGEFWSWLGDLRSVTKEHGLVLRTYCYNEAAEDTQMRRVGAGLGLRDEVEALLASEEWIDLLKVFDSQLLTGGSVGLKKVAPLGGFSWEVEDAGGDISMVYYEQAVSSADPDLAEAARRWLLTYNRNDVEATAALRSWLGTQASRCPGIETVAFG